MTPEEIFASRRQAYTPPPLVPSGEDPPDLPVAFPVFARPPGLPQTCTDAMLCEAVKCFLLGTDEKTLARMLCVPKSAVRYWTDSKEWAALIKMYTPEIESMLKGQLTRVASMALRQLEDRLNDGDQVFNQQGECVARRELKGRELAEIATRVLEQRANLEKLVGDLGDDKEKLSIQDLAVGLKKFVQAKDVTAESRRAAD